MHRSLRHKVLQPLNPALCREAQLVLPADRPYPDTWNAPRYLLLQDVQ